MADVEKNLEKLGLTLPQPAVPVANYVPWVVSGKTLYISGQLPVGENGLIKGTLGRDMTVEAGALAARACALSILAQVRAATNGDFSRVARCVKLGAFVASAAEFFDHPKVVNGASDLMVAALGEKGKHARFAVGVPCLPLGAAVEIDAVFELA